MKSVKLGSLLQKGFKNVTATLGEKGISDELAELEKYIPAIEVDLTDTSERVDYYCFSHYVHTTH